MIEKFLNWLDRLGDGIKNQLIAYNDILELLEEIYNDIFGYPVGKVLLWFFAWLLWSTFLIGIVS